MTVRDRILARRDLDTLRANRDITALAAALNAQPEMVHQTRFITARAVITTCTGGIDILAALEAAEDHMAVKWALKFLSQEAGLDIGDPATHLMLDHLASVGILTSQQISNLKAMSLKPAYVTQEQVAQALYNPDGTEK